MSPVSFHPIFQDTFSSQSWQSVAEIKGCVLYRQLGDELGLIASELEHNTPCLCKSTNTKAALSWTWPCEMATLIATEQHKLSALSLFFFKLWISKGGKKIKKGCYENVPQTCDLILHPFPPNIYICRLNSFLCGLHRKIRKLIN